MQVKEIYNWLDAYAPFAGQERWDNSGLLVGSMEQEVHGVLLTLDISSDAVEEAARKPHLHVCGLMTIPPKTDVEKYFFRMQKLFIDISAENMDNIDMHVLSMGMSGDYVEAIKYGSTLVRIGSALFGARG